MWLGEQITERGIGNGISLIIFAGIVAGLPRAIGGTLELVRTGSFTIILVLIHFDRDNFNNWFCCIYRKSPKKSSC